MRHYVTATIAALSFLTTPTLAENFYCPAPQILPRTLNLSSASPNQPELKQIQKYLSNLTAINRAYQRTNRHAVQDQLTNCLMDQLLPLAENQSLQLPQTRADGATWFLIHDEVLASLQLQFRYARLKPQLPYIANWLNNLPYYAATTVATR